MPLAATFAAAPGAPAASVGATDGVTVAELTADPGAHLDRIRAAFGTERLDIAAARLIELWTWTLAAPAATALVTARRLPDLGAANVAVDPESFALRLGSGRFLALPGDPAASHPDAHVVPDEEALLRALNRTVADDHVAPLATMLNALTRRPLRALWRSAADRLMGGFAWSGDRLGRAEEAYALGRTALACGGPLRARAEVVRIDGAPFHVRDGCCLHWRCPDGEKCANCPLLDAAERPARIAAEAQAAA